MNINPFINLISAILSIYSFMLLTYVIIYYLLMFGVVNRHNQFVNQVYNFLIKAIEPLLGRIRRYIPPIAGIDISIIVVFLAIYFIRDILYTYFYTYS